MKLIATCLLTAGVVLAGGKTYPLNLFQRTTVNGTALEPGSYRVEVLDSKVVIKAGRKVVEAPMKAHVEEKKWEVTSVKLDNGSDAAPLRELRLAGSNLHIVLD
jgi:hypothetical protein